MTSYPWGRIADIYGRKFVLVVTLIIASICSLVFGLSNSYTMAIIVRFLMGAGNGTMTVSFTSISELAKGDKELETKGVGMLISMVGYGMLVCPAIGGFLAEPLAQYPNFVILGGALDGLLTKFPFLLPNLLGTLLSLLSMCCIVLYMEETLPLEQRRHWKHAGSDLVQWLGNCLVGCCPRASQVAVSDVQDPEIANEKTPLNNTPAPAQQGNSVMSILSKDNTRAYLISAWCNHLASITQTEALPLFAMAIVGGLGMEEKTIGLVGTVAGLIYCLAQYTIFRATIKRFGVVRSMQYGALIGGISMILFPASLFFHGFSQIFVLSLVSSTVSISRSIVMGGTTIGCNRTVDASNRAAMNGVNSTGTGFARALGPVLTGWLMAFCLSGRMFPAEWGSWVAYTVLVGVGLLAYWSTLRIPSDISSAP
ncbi:ZINC INDUCED FACILITATOR [Seminavis robusta]|uniref:ZINC INDUCED FACILITATOR n=1 Tax=Seminavis robusta TaxID=568900 RepID=A0A9N8F180_9STRA|nr:ZINC INDUCED FACILITATOR [Seminavis robusta]|eukprot:Sro2482_g328880.1 ZINC INDUCED FACILITATOR (425) ;mRNA; r:1192-2545